MPPLMAFHLGSLSFLCPFEFSDYKEKVDEVLRGVLTLGFSYLLFLMKIGINH